ncbi:hypothetical protein P692DRAFT_20183343 [Suillus brevipes Sb2]|nr:hypothetical protein P692DRAFT_20183343 [Suillus brevipes Sb2]
MNLTLSLRRSSGEESAAMQVSHWEFFEQKVKQCSTSASMGVAEIDDAIAATTARTIAEEKRIVSEDVI